MFFKLFKKIVKREPKMLIVGHDLKFLTPVIDHLTGIYGSAIETHTYSGHIIPEKKKLLKILPEYQVLFCEWGLGNIRFLSKNKLPGQTLIVRIHSQEFRTKFLEEAKWEAVDVIIFISEFQMERFIRQFPGQASKCRLIYNVIDCPSFSLDKNGSAMFTLGMLGILPKSKAPSAGLEILHALKQHDPRFRLSIKSKRPEELAWLYKNEEERAYYHRFYELIEQMELTGSIDFEPHGNDVPDWFSRIGFILSTSEFEGSHQSVAEGMAAGSIPVIRNWDGSVPLYPDRFSFSNTAEAVEIILKYRDAGTFAAESDAVKRYAAERFDQSVILPKYQELIEPGMLKRF